MGRGRAFGSRGRLAAVSMVLALAAAACSGSEDGPEPGPEPDGEPIIDTFAGGGDAGLDAEGVPALEAELAGPTAIVVDPDGNFFVAEEWGDRQRIRRIDPDGTVTTVVGTGSSEACDVGPGPALQAVIPSPHGLAIGPDGNLYVASVFCFAVFRLEDDGTLTVVAGQPGVQGFAGDGGPATEASFVEPSQLAFDADGNLFVTDYVDHRIRRIDTEGIITTIAGTGEPGDAGDGGPAVDAQLNVPDGLAFDADGNLYVTEIGGSRIRRIDPEGIITTVLGGDDGAELRSPHDVDFDAEGNLYVLEVNSNQVRVMGADGTLRDFVGKQSIEGGAFSGDGGPASEAELDFPQTMMFDAEGNLYICDAGNDRVRIVRPAA